MTTEENILGKASEIFYRKGLAGGRMQEIADEAGINKAMLHYYYKTKELLFDKVFAHAFEDFVGRIAVILNSDMELNEKITKYVGHTIDALAKHPGMPVFILNELTHSPQRIAGQFTGIYLVRFKDQVEKQSKGKTDAETLFIDMVSLCVYPFVVAPIFKKLLHKTDQQYAGLLQSRKKHIVTEILKRI